MCCEPAGGGRAFPPYDEIVYYLPGDVFEFIEPSQLLKGKAPGELQHSFDESSEILIALVLQFKNIVKPFLVLAGVPFGFSGGIVALWIMNASFSFMAFLGLISLVGVIVSHIIIIFDFIEQMHDKGEPFEEAVLDAGVVRLRPVLITVAATVLALIPLALHGGPMWAPLCYAQIGGLTVATLISLLIIPVIYAICVEDLKIIKWETRKLSS